MGEPNYNDDKYTRTNYTAVVAVKPSCNIETPLQAVFMPPKCYEQTWKRKNKNSRF